MIGLAFDIKQLTSHLPLFSLANCSRQFTPNGSQYFCLKLKKKTAAECSEQKMISMKKDLIDILAPGSIRELEKLLT